MLERVRPGQEPELQAFLTEHAVTSMFLRGNLERFGLTPSDHPHSTTFYAWRPAGAIEAAFGCTNDGYLMCQVPDLCAPATRAFALALVGREIKGMTGDAAQVALVVESLGIAPSDWHMQRDDPLFALSLEHLPDIGDAVVLRRPTQLDEDLLAGWFFDYEVDTGLSQPGAALQQSARNRAKAATSAPDLRLMIEDGAPVAMTGFNARAADMVQVGGVFVPRERRNQGLGRKVVCAHLQEARASGSRHAILFAANPAAARAYEAIGFRKIGDYRIALLSKPRVMGV